MNLEIIQNISESLEKSLPNADQIWVSIALINYDGLKFILKNIKTTCKQNYIVGIDLPTDPKALKLLNELQLKTDLQVKIYTQKNNFHPKLYLISTNNIYSAFIGSANCTNGGLFNNIELSAYIQDHNACIKILEWFNEINSISIPLTTKYVLQYEKGFKDRLERKKADNNYVNSMKSIFNLDLKVSLAEKSELVKVLKIYRKSIDYFEIVNKRTNSVLTLRQDLDFPNYNNIDIERYFSHRELGHLIHIAKPVIKRNIDNLRLLLKYLTNESIDIAIRYDRCLTGDLKVNGVGKAFISKILAVHEPTLYFVKNGKSERALKKYGIEFPRGLSDGEKYKITCKFLRQICIETNIKDLTILDYYLYLQG